MASLESLASATNVLAKTMALKETKSHYLAMAKFFKGMKENKKMNGYLTKLQDLESVDVELENELSPTVSECITLEGGINNKKKKKNNKPFITTNKFMSIVVIVDYLSHLDT